MNMIQDSKYIRRSARSIKVSSKRSVFIPSFFLADLAKQIENKSESGAFHTLSHGLEAELLLQNERKDERRENEGLDETLIILALRQTCILLLCFSVVLCFFF